MITAVCIFLIFLTRLTTTHSQFCPLSPDNHWTHLQQPITNETIGGSLSCYVRSLIYHQPYRSLWLLGSEGVTQLPSTPRQFPLSYLLLLHLWVDPFRVGHSQSAAGSTWPFNLHPSLTPTNFMSSFITPLSLTLSLSRSCAPLAASPSFLTLSPRSLFLLWPPHS